MAHETVTSKRPQDIVKQWLTEATDVDGGDAYLNRRRHKRYIWTGTIDVYAGSHCRRSVPVMADCRDISEMGMGLRCRMKLAVGTTIYICRGGTGEGIRARVAVCTQTVGGYIVGVQFDFGAASIKGAFRT